MDFLMSDGISRGLGSTWAVHRACRVCSALVPAEGLVCQMLEEPAQLACVGSCPPAQGNKGEGWVGMMRSLMCPIPLFVAGFTLHPGKAAC